MEDPRDRGAMVRRSFLFTGGLPLLVITTVGRKTGQKRIGLPAGAVVIGAVEGPGDDPGTSGEAELGLDVLDVRLDGARGDEQAVRDLAVGQSPELNGPLRW
jgi:hypothetical protein